MLKWRTWGTYNKVKHDRVNLGSLVDQLPLQVHDLISVSVKNYNNVCKTYIRYCLHLRRSLEEKPKRTSEHLNRVKRNQHLLQLQNDTAIFTCAGSSSNLSTIASTRYGALGIAEPNVPSIHTNAAYNPNISGLYEMPNGHAYLCFRIFQCCYQSAYLLNSSRCQFRVSA